MFRLSSIDLPPTVWFQRQPSHAKRLSSFKAVQAQVQTIWEALLERACTPLEAKATGLRLRLMLRLEADAESEAETEAEADAMAAYRVSPAKTTENTL